MSDVAASEAPTRALAAKPNHPQPAALPNLLSSLGQVNSWVNYDFCPWANRYFNWLRSPLAWMAAAAIAAGLVGLVAVPQGWGVCGALVGTMTLGAIWPWVAVRGVSAELSFERTRCHEGDELFVELAVVNRWPWPVWGLLLEGCLDEDAALARVSAWSKARYRFAWRPERRGPWPRGTPRITTGFPFGLWTCHRPIAVAHGLIVWPRLTALRSAPFDRCEQAAIAGGLLDRAGDEGDLLSARPYRPGDSPRRIHWAHTSRRDMLIVCERQTASQRHAVLVLEPRAFSECRNSLGEAAGPETRSLDAALRVLASICLALHRHGWRIECELAGEPIRISPQPSALRSLWDRLALHCPATASGGLALTVGSAGGSAGGSAVGSAGGGLRIVVTDESGWQSQPVSSRRRMSDPIRWVVVDTVASGELTAAHAWSSGDISGVEPWIRVAVDGGEEGERDWRRQWERRCHGDEAHA
ncbi:MAG: DUF58 domain-containing protein [Planctomycetota bacterium]